MDTKVSESVKKIIIDVINFGDIEIGGDQNLYDSGYLDSMLIAMIIPQLEQFFSIKEISPEDMIPENFSSINQIANLVQRYLNKE